MREGSIGAALIPPGAGNPSRVERLRAWLRAQVEAQSLRWRLWAPVALGAGCATYFGLKVEPPLWPLLMAAGVAAGVWLGVRRTGRDRRWTLPLMLIACFASGLMVAKLRTEAVMAPIAPAMAEPTTLEAWVIDVDSPGARGARVVIAPVWIRGLEPEQTPARLRATVKGPAPAPGTPIRLFAILNPPPAPASPGAYDFGRVAFFQEMGGVAFALTETRPARLEPPPWRVRAQMAINQARFDLATRIVERLGPRTGGVAAAMVTGHEAWLEEEDLDAMRDSGLAHILSISGLHMAVVGGFAFLLFRLLVAAWPWLALRVSGKKLAAWGGLIAVSTYLVVSGGPAPAQRAAITASIAFLAILLDRPAITMHGLAVAAFVVLILQPEAIVTPGFQMSFAATCALVALVESWPPRTREIQAPWPIVAVQRAGAWAMAACAASLVAGMATGPFAMQHFNRTAVFGLVANLATSPVADLIMMPALALGAVLEPVGLGAPFLWVAGQAIDMMLAIGHWTAGLSGAVRTVASAPGAALPFAFMGVLILCLVKGRLRWIGLPLAMAVLLWPRPPAPDLWIGEGGTNGAWRIGSEAVVLRPGVREFAADVWSRRRGLALAQRPAEGWTCSRYACAPGAEGPLAMWWGRQTPSDEQLTAMCAAAAVVSVRAQVTRIPAGCEARLVLDGVDYAQGGAVELWRDGPGWRAVWTAEVRGDRPWSRWPDAEAAF